MAFESVTGFVAALTAALGTLASALSWLQQLHPALALAVLIFLGYAAYRAFRFLGHILACAVLFALIPLALGWLGLAPPPTLSGLLAAATFGVLFFLVYSLVLGEIRLLSWLLSPFRKKEKRGKDEQEKKE